MRMTKWVLSILTFATTIGGIATGRQALADQWWNCQPTAVFEVVAGGVRQFQVECSNTYPPNSAVNFAGAPLSGVGALTDAQASRFASMAEAAIVSGRIFRIHIIDANVCASTTNCRYADAWSLYH